MKKSEGVQLKFQHWVTKNHLSETSIKPFRFEMVTCSLIYQ